MVVALPSVEQHGIRDMAKDEFEAIWERLTNRKFDADPRFGDSHTYSTVLPDLTPADVRNIVLDIMEKRNA